MLVAIFRTSRAGRVIMASYDLHAITNHRAY